MTNRLKYGLWIGLATLVMVSWLPLACPDRGLARIRSGEVGLPVRRPSPPAWGSWGAQIAVAVVEPQPWGPSAKNRNSSPKP